MEDAVTRYVKDLRGAPYHITSEPSEATLGKGVTAAIVGSTGYVGSNLVASLLQNIAVSHIYCLGRDSNSAARLASGRFVKGHDRRRSQNNQAQLHPKQSSEPRVSVYTT